jgi:hypothetical protein
MIPSPTNLIDRAPAAVPCLPGRDRGFPRLLEIAVGKQLHRPFQVSEEHGDLIALGFEGGLGGEDLLGEVFSGRRTWGSERGLGWFGNGVAHSIFVASVTSGELQ